MKKRAIRVTAGRECEKVSLTPGRSREGGIQGERKLHMVLLDVGIGAAIGGVLLVFATYRVATRLTGWGPSDT